MPQERSERSSGVPRALHEGSEQAEPGVPLRTLEENRRFLETHTVLAPVPLVPEIAVRVASEVTPLWQATEAWLACRGIEPPFWAFPWAGGQALARYILDAPETVRGLRVLDFACGSGLVGLAAVRSGAASVASVDTDPLAAVAATMNAESASAALHVHVGDWVGRDLRGEGFDVLLAGDVFYDATAAPRFVAWFRELAKSGVRVLAGDPGRTYVPTVRVLVRQVVHVAVPEGLEGKPSLEARVLEVLE